MTDLRKTKLPMLSLCLDVDARNFGMPFTRGYKFSFRLGHVQSLKRRFIIFSYYPA